MRTCSGYQRGRGNRTQQQNIVGLLGPVRRNIDVHEGRNNKDKHLMREIDVLYQHGNEQNILHFKYNMDHPEKPMVPMVSPEGEYSELVYCPFPNDFTRRSDGVLVADVQTFNGPCNVEIIVEKHRVTISDILEEIPDISSVVEVSPGIWKEMVADMRHVQKTINGDNAVEMLQSLRDASTQQQIHGTEDLSTTLLGPRRSV